MQLFGLGAVEVMQVNVSRFIALDMMWLVMTDAHGEINRSTAFSQLLGVSAGFNPLALLPDGARISIDRFMVPAAAPRGATPTLPWLISSDRYDDIAGFGTYEGTAVVWGRDGKALGAASVALLSRRGNPLPGHRGRRLDLKRAVPPKPKVLTAKQIGALHDVPDRDAVEYRRWRKDPKDADNWLIVGYDANGTPVASTREVVVLSEGEVKHWEGVNVNKRLPHGNVGEGDRFWVMALENAAVIPTAPVVITEKAWNALPAPFEGYRAGTWETAVFQRKPWVSENSGAHAYGVLYLDGQGRPVAAASKDRLWHKQDNSPERRIHSAMTAIVNFLDGDIFGALGRVIAGALTGAIRNAGPDGLRLGLGAAIARMYGGSTAQVLSHGEQQDVAKKLMGPPAKVLGRKAVDELGDQRLVVLGSITMPLLAPIFLAAEALGKHPRLHDIPGWGSFRGKMVDVSATTLHMAASGQIEEIIVRISQVLGVLTFGTSAIVGTIVGEAVQVAINEVAARATRELVGGQAGHAVALLTRAGVDPKLAQVAMQMIK